MERKSRRPGEGSGSGRSTPRNVSSLTPATRGSQTKPSSNILINTVHDFIAFMTECGVKPVEPIAHRLAPGELIRFRCDGDRSGRLNGWAVLHLDGRPVGAFGNFRTDTGTLRWQSGSYRRSASAVDEAAFRRKAHLAKKRYEAQRRAKNEQAAVEAAAMWQGAVLAAPEHPYIVRKQIDHLPLRQIGQDLLIGMFGDDGHLWNIQRVRPNGSKRFLRGGRVGGLFHIVGTITANTRRAVITEGYATADAVFRASGVPAIVAFSAQNMAAVARVWKAHRPDMEYIVFGDDDRATEANTGRNPGRQAAITAALEIGAKVTFAHAKE